jgi:HEAT repeat protein
LSDVSRRELAAGALAQLPPSRIAVLARGLRHPQAEVRSATVEALGRIQRQEASQLVIEALTDNAPKVREAAVVTLARIGARDLEPTFARLAANDSSKTVRRAATAALARLRD